jgi:hypothetical protein
MAPTSVVPAVALVALVAVPLWAWALRGRGYAVFGLVVLAVALPGALLSHGRLRAWLPPAVGPWLDAAFAYAELAAAVHLAALARPRLRPRAFRAAVSVPGMAYLAAGALAGLWLLALLPVRGALALVAGGPALAALPGLDFVPFGVAALSVVTSLRLVDEVVRVRLARDGPARVARLPLERHRGRRPPPPARRPLRIVQIADPHLGPWQPVACLRRRIERLLLHAPDLVCLTGDFLTMEGAGTRGALAEALTPLARFRGRCFAVFGNHDHGAADEVRHALDANGVRLLVDAETTVTTAVGPVQIVGSDWVARGRRAHLEDLLARWPRRPGHLRLLLLHDPSAFCHVPKGDVDLTLSGHTHGGQLGLVSLGLDWTVLAHSAWPDHGFFGHGSNRLYVHRGTGFYGFPLRVGVPGEASLLEVIPP